MGGFLGIGHTSAKTDRSQTLGAYGDLQNIFNYGMGASQGQLAKGNATENQALSSAGAADSYYKSLLTGNRTATLQAAAPTINAANAQEDATKRQLDASGTARGGGANAITQQMDTNKSATIDNAIMGAKEGAAAGETNVARVEAGVGATQLEAAARLLGIGSSSASNLASISADSRKTSNEINQQTQSQIGQFAGTLLFGG